MSKKSIMYKRAFFIAIVLTVIGFGYVIFNLYKIQITNGDSYKQAAISQQVHSTTINAKRGTIYSGDGQVLAASTSSWNVVFSPANLKEGQEKILADGMEKIIGIDKDYLLEKANNKNSFYQVIKNDVEKEIAEKAYEFAKENGITGVSLIPDSTRYYPYKTLASTVLGFVNTDNGGAYGLEAYYDNVLSGTPGKTVTAKNALGIDMPYTYQDVTGAKDGNNLILTLDSNIQSIIEKHLSISLTEHMVQNRALVIVQDVNTGAILGMATMPDYDSNTPQNVISEISLEKISKIEKDSDEYWNSYAYEQQLQWSNKAVNESYEPGSVFKVITTAMALETDSVTMNSTFECNGSYLAGGIRKHCWNHYGHGVQTLAQAIQNSCNPAYMQIGQKIGGTNFYNYFKSFGLTEPTGIDMPGEESGVFYNEKQLNGTEGNLETAAFGQSFKITPIQLITAISATVNGGYLYKPYIVDKITDNNGNIVDLTIPEIKRQVISKDTSKKICELMAGVVKYGSGKNASVPGYSIGGKTGTSEKLDSDRGFYTYSFVGVAPMDNPRVAVLLILDEPYETDLYGSTVAAPTVGAILSEILPYLNVETTYTAEESAVKEVKIPNAIGLTAHMGMEKMINTQLSSIIVGKGDKVIEQIPSAGSIIEKWSTVFLYTDEESKIEMVSVPDITGKTSQAAKVIIENAGLNVKIEKDSWIDEAMVIEKQNIEKNTMVPRGTIITASFRKSEDNEKSNE